MTKLNEKPLSQMLEEIEPVELPSGKFVHKAEYLKLKHVAIELAKALEKQKFCVTFCDDTRKVRDKALSRAKDIIGEGKP